MKAPILPAELTASTLDQLEPQQTLEGMVLSDRLSLETSRLEACEVSSSKLRQATFSDVILSDCLLFGSDFDGAGWQRVEVKRGLFSGVVLTDMSLRDVKFSGVKVNLANFRTSKLRDVAFIDCALTDADFQSAELTNVSFSGCDLSGTDFSGVTCSKVDLRSSEIATIRGVTSLRGVTISRPQLITLSQNFANELGIIITD
jgi:uncharacterized protein YjbI with pentapeptide repeats